MIGRFCTECGHKQGVSAPAPAPAPAPVRPVKVKVASPKPKPKPKPVVTKTTDTKLVDQSSAAGLPLIDDQQFNDLLSVMSRGHMDVKSQKRRIVATLSSYQYTCAQVLEIAKVTQGWYSRLKTYAPVVMYPNIQDKQNFDSVISFYKFKDEKDDIRKMTAKLA